MPLLDAGEADLTIGVPARQGAGGRILTRPLFEDRFVCILRRDHPAASQPLDLAAFLGLSHLLISPEGDRFGQVDAVLAAQGKRRRVALSLPQMYAAPGVVACSDMIATVLESIVAASASRDRLAKFPPPLDLETVTFVMSWHRRNEANPVQQWMRETIANLLRSHPSI